MHKNDDYEYLESTLKSTHKNDEPTNKLVPQNGINQGMYLPLFVMHIRGIRMKLNCLKCNSFRVDALFVNYE